MDIPLRRHFLLNYLSLAPLPLAIERVMECRLYSILRFEKPVLDVGCGDGVFASVLFKEMVCTGIDLDIKELKRAGKLNIYGELIRCSADDVPKPDGHFNTIFSNSVLEHIRDVVPVLNELFRLLAPGGKCYLTVPSTSFEHYTVINQILTGIGMDDTAADYRKFFNRFWKHYHCYSLSGWQKMVEKCGFQIVNTFAYNPKRLCLLNDFLVPFSIGGLIMKKTINRWTLFPRIRKIWIYPFFLWLRRMLDTDIRSDQGGLIFLSLTK